LPDTVCARVQLEICEPPVSLLKKIKNKIKNFKKMFFNFFKFEKLKKKYKKM